MIHSWNHANFDYKYFFTTALVRRTGRGLQMAIRHITCMNRNITCMNHNITCMNQNITCMNHNITCMNRQTSIEPIRAKQTTWTSSVIGWQNWGQIGTRLYSTNVLSLVFSSNCTTFQSYSSYMKLSTVQTKAPSAKGKKLFRRILFL